MFDAIAHQKKNAGAVSLPDLSVEHTLSDFLFNSNTGLRSVGTDLLIQFSKVFNRPWIEINARFLPTAVRP